MYLCEACGNVFEEASVKVVKAPYSGERFREPEDVEAFCPLCGSGDFEEAQKCPLCGKWHTGCDDACVECIALLEEQAARIRRTIDDVRGDLIAEIACGNSLTVKILEEMVA